MRSRWMFGLVLALAGCAPGVAVNAELPCIPGETRCASFGEQQTCSVDGLAWVASSCAEDEVCGSRRPGGFCLPRGDEARSLDLNLDATLRFETIDGGVCTAFLVNDTTALTNSHCCNYTDGGCTGGVVYPAYRSADHTETGYPVIRTLFVDAAHDVSALEIAGLAAGAIEPVEIARRRGDELRAEQIYLIGHPAGRPQESAIGIVWGAAAEVTYAYRSGSRTKHAQIVYWSRAEGGNSGSPVFALHGHVLVGIHHTGGVTPDMFALTTQETDGFTELLAGTDGAAIADLLDEHGIEFDEMEE